MPTDQSVGLNNSEGIWPVEQTRQSSQCKADGVGRQPRFHFSLHKKPKLFAQKQIFRRDGGFGSQAQLYKGY